jgi:Arc/MetJ family transcription regulator
MSKRLVDIDDETLAMAATVLRAKTMKETVNRALESVVIADRRPPATARRAPDL